MTTTPLAIDLAQHVDIAASAEQVFAGLLEQMGADNSRPDGVKMPMRVEPFPGGRWYRDLGQNAGHLWGHVQVCKPPQLLELWGPMFMSYPAVNWIQYRLETIDGGTRLTLRHQAIGAVTDEHREGVRMGWKHILECVKARCE